MKKRKKREGNVPPTPGKTKRGGDQQLLVTASY